MPPQSMGQIQPMGQQSPIDEGYQNYIQDMQQFGYSSPALEKLYGPVHTKATEQRFELQQLGPQRLQAVIQAMGGPEAFNSLSKHEQTQVALEAMGMKSFAPQSPQMLQQHMVSPATMGSAAPDGQLDVAGRPVDKNGTYRLTQYPGQEVMWQRVAPSTGTSPTADGKVQVFDRRNGEVIGPVANAVTPSMMERTKSNASYTDTSGIQHAQSTSRVGSGPGAAPMPNGMPAPVAGVMPGGIVNKHQEQLVKGTNAEIDKLSKPSTDLMARVSRFNESMNNPNLMTNAIAVPEFLTIMAGGAGSGLRMTDTELNRIFGGRTKLGEAKALYEKWLGGEATATSLTPVQRQQMKELAKAIQQKAVWKQDLFNAARDMTKDLPDQAGHRAVVNFVNREMVNIDKTDTDKYKPFHWNNPEAVQGLKGALLGRK
jgi:hypothetical protein